MLKKKTALKKTGSPPFLAAYPGNDLALLPALSTIWLDLRKEYFPDREDIDKYEVVWSARRQKRTLASCNIKRKRVIVASELNDARYLPMLSPLLYHEMCHAYLGALPRVNGKRRSWHGREFRILERQHPGIPFLDGWIKTGGWLTAVRRARTKSWWQGV
jgi:hypothetical protein